MVSRVVGGAVTAALLGLAMPAAAQLGQSDSYQFLQAVKDAKGDDVTKVLDKTNGSIINSKTRDEGEGALHIVARRGDATYVNFLLSRGADPNLKDARGNTPLMVAATAGETGVMDLLVKRGANVNLGNASGETPLIRAVQRRDIEMVRVLMANGADPDQADRIAGLSARDYAKQDTRAPAIAKLIAETPKKERRAVAGPRL